MKESRNIPKLRFPEFQEEWKYQKIENSYSLISGQHLSPDEYCSEPSNNIPYFTGPSDFTNNFKENNKWSIKKGKVAIKDDILITVKGNGVGTLMLLKLPKVTMGRQLMAIRSNCASTMLLYHYLALKKNYFVGLASGNMIPGLSRSDILQTKICLPSLFEQQKIASFLTAVDNKIQQLSKRKSLLEQYKKGVMQKIFRQQIRFKDEGGKDFPEWQKKKLGEVIRERNIKAPKSESYPLMSFVAHKGVTSKGERYNREFLVNDEDNKKYKQTEYGDFIYSSNNLETGSIGLNRYGSASISPVYSIFEVGDLCNYQFIGSYFLRKSFINKMIRFRQGVVYGQWRIHESDFLEIKEKFPSIEEQQKIAKFLSAIDAKIEQVNTQLEKTKAFKKGLLQQMFV